MDGTAPAARRQRFGNLPVADMEHVARGERPPPVSAEPAERKRRTAAEVLRHVDSAGDGEITALPATGCADFEHIALLRGDRRVPGDLRSVQCRRKLSAGQSKERIRIEAERGARKRHLQPRSLRRVSDDPVGQPETVRIHRPRRRNADRPVTETAGIILHRGLRSGERISNVGAE